MYNFLLNMWIMRKIDEIYLSARVAKGQITEQEKQMILATPQIQGGGILKLLDEIIKSTVSSFGQDDLKFLELSGRKSFYSQGYEGEGMVIAVIDTGVSPHEEFEDRLLPGFNANRLYQNPSNTIDDDGHGTHVASSIAGKNVGIAPKAKILPVKVLDGSGGLANMYDLVKAIDWARKWRSPEGKPVDIISMSLGGPANAFGGHFDLIHSSIQACVNDGILVVCAAGNTGSEADHYPGSFNEVLCVGAVDVNKAQAKFTTTGDQVDICQVGVDVIGANFEGGYIALSGTSMATPIISGIAALIACRHKKKFKTRITEQKLFEQLKMNTKDLGIAGVDKIYGVGFACLQPLNLSIEMENGSKLIKFNNQIVEADVPSRIENGRFLFEMRSLAEQTGAYISFEAENEYHKTRAKFNW